MARAKTTLRPSSSAQSSASSTCSMQPTKPMVCAAPSPKAYQGTGSLTALKPREAILTKSSLVMKELRWRRTTSA